MNVKLLLQYAYEAVLDDIAERERRVSIYRTNQPSLPSRSFYRATSRHDTWARREELREKEHQADRKRLVELYQLIVDLEAQYKIWHDADDELDARGLAEFIKSRK